MFRLELKKNLVGISIIVSIMLLYIVFMLGNAGVVQNGDTPTTIIGAIWGKFHNNWHMCADSSCLQRMYDMWSDNRYLPILMPFICGLPSVLNYLEERSTGNKRMILIRCSMKKYYVSKLFSNIVTAIMIALAAIILYYGTLFIFFDKLPITNEEFKIVYFSFSNKMVGDVSQISMALIVIKMIKGVLYFSIYAAISSTFCLWLAAIFRDKYTTFGASVFLCYFQYRILEEVARRDLAVEGSIYGKIVEVFEPIFLHFAGNSGIYEQHEYIALLIAFCLVAFNCFIFIWISRRHFDVSEG